MDGRTPPSHATARPPVKRPDARPMRAILGASGLAALAAVASAVVAQPKPDVGPEAVSDPTPIAPATQPLVQRPVRYVQLEPGQTAPPGARVIQAGAPTPIVVTVVSAPVRRPVVVQTTQSGTGK